MHCPTCEQELRAADRAGVELDYCPSCRGVWLEAEELDKLLEPVPAGTGAAPPPDGPGDGAPHHWSLDVPFYDFG